MDHIIELGAKCGERQPRLLIVTTIPGTIRAFLLPYADHFRAKGWRVDAMANGLPGEPDIAEHFDCVYDAKWTRNPFSPSSLTSGRQAARIVVEDDYDIVHVHTPVASYVMRRALSLIRLDAKETTGRPKVVYTAHGFHFFKGASARRNLIYRTLERRAARWTDRLIVINREDWSAARRGRFMPPGALVFMPGIGLDFARYDRSSVRREDVLAVRTEMGLKDDDILFTMIAEFIPRKRHRDVIEALAKTKDPRIHVAFAGDGPLRNKMQELARTHSVHQRTHFLGFVRDPKPLIIASRATILPSEQEGLARALMESACLRVPMIGTDARGVRDAIEPRRGLLYPVGDTYALRDAMLRMVEEPYGDVRPDPDWRIEDLIDQHERLYAELLAEAKDERERYIIRTKAMERRAKDEADRAAAEAEARRVSAEQRAELKRIERERKAADRAEREKRAAEEREIKRKIKEERARKREEERAIRDSEKIRRMAEKDAERAARRAAKEQQRRAKAGMSTDDDYKFADFNELDGIQSRIDRIDRDKE